MCEDWLLFSDKTRVRFMVWAKCAWDGKIRGFVLEKVRTMSSPFFFASHAVKSRTNYLEAL